MLPKPITYAALVVQIFIGSTNSQDLTDLPQCAQVPSLKSIRTTNCQLTDFACICNDKAYTSSLEPVIKQACSPEDYQKTLQFTQDLCGSVGVTVSNNANTTIAATTSMSPSLTSITVPSSTSSAAAKSNSIQPGSGAASTRSGLRLATVAIVAASVLNALAA